MNLPAPPSPTIFRTLSDANNIAADLQSSDPDWTYKVETRPNGMAVVMCYDEDGNLLHCGM